MSSAMLFKLPYFMWTRFMLMRGSDAYWERRIGSRALKVGGRTLKAKAQALIELQGEFGVPAEQWTVPMIRGGYNKSMSLFDGPKHSLSKVEDLTLDLPGRSVGGRLYDPKPGDKGRRCLLYFHGGGFVIGGLESHDRLCRKIALETGAPVIAVDYRMGPENRFPSAMLDALDSWSWLQEKASSFDLDPARITVGGDSAGAALALLVASEASNDTLGNRPAATALIYPPMMTSPDTEARRLLGKENIVLTQELLDWFASHFEDKSQTEYEALLSPLERAVSGQLGPVWIRTCGFDPLRDDGVMIAERLKELGTDVDMAEYEDLYHGFIGASAVLPDVDVMVVEMSRFLALKTGGKEKQPDIQAAE